MSSEYHAISWNRQKKIYDMVVFSLLLTYILLFVGISAWGNPTATAETLLIRAFGTAAFLLLHVVLCIGPAVPAAALQQAAPRRDNIPHGTRARRVRTVSVSRLRECKPAREFVCQQPALRQCCRVSFSSSWIFRVDHPLFNGSDES